MKARSKPRVDRSAKRDRMLEEAARTLNSGGISRTSLANIAQALGVSRTALYYYFRDQQDLAFQSYQRSCAIMAQQLNAVSPLDGGALVAIEAFIDGVLGEDQVEWASLSEVAYLHPDQQGEIEQLYDAIRGDMAAMLQAGIARGELRPCAVNVVAHTILGLLSWVAIARRWQANAAVDRQVMAQAAKAVLRVGIARDRRSLLDYQPLKLSSNDVPSAQLFDPKVLAEAKQNALLASASWLFNLKGVDATSLDEVAERMGVTKRVIYHNVGDKEALLVACYRRSFSIYEELSERMTAYAGPRMAALCASMHAHSAAHLREDVAPLSPLIGLGDLPPAVMDEIHAAGFRLRDSYSQVCTEGMREGSVREIQHEAFIAIFPSFYQWLPKWLHLLSADERKAAPQELAELIRVGLLPV